MSFECQASAHWPVWQGSWGQCFLHQLLRYTISYTYVYAHMQVYVHVRTYIIASSVILNFDHIHTYVSEVFMTKKFCHS